MDAFHKIVGQKIVYFFKGQLIGTTIPTIIIMTFDF